MLHKIWNIMGMLHKIKDKNGMLRKIEIIISGAGGILYNNRTLVKSALRKFNFLISQPKHMLWVLKRTVSMRQFF